jgi:hypothetical protein
MATIFDQVCLFKKKNNVRQKWWSGWIINDLDPVRLLVEGLTEFGGVMLFTLFGGAAGLGTAGGNWGALRNGRIQSHPG